MVDWDNFFIKSLIVGMTVFVILVIVALVTDVQDAHKGRIAVCEEIAKLKGLHYYAYTSATCHSNLGCTYVCKFLDSEGDIVTKNVE